MRFARSRKPREEKGRWSRNLARILFVTIWVGLLGTTTNVTPASAADCTDRRNNDTSFWVPQDVIGEKYKIYCPDGTAVGSWDRTGGTDMNGGDDWKFDQDSLKEYGTKHLTLGGAPDFSGLKEEPCEVFHPDVNKGEKVDFWLQCAKITGNDRGARYSGKKLSDKPYNYKGPEKNYGQYWQNKIIGAGVDVCSQWYNVFELLGKKPPPDFASRVTTCRNDGDNAMFQLKIANPRIDNNTYDIKDYSGPKDMVDELNGALALAMWVGLFCAVIGVLACAGQMAVAHQKGGEALIGVQWVLVGSVVILFAAGIGLMIIK